MKSISRRSLATSIAAAVAVVPTLALSAVPVANHTANLSMIDRVRAFALRLVNDRSDPMQIYAAWLEQWRIGNELLSLVDGNAVKISAVGAATWMDHEERIKYHTKHLAWAMRDRYGLEAEVLTYDGSDGTTPCGAARGTRAQAAPIAKSRQCRL